MLYSLKIFYFFLFSIQPNPVCLSGFFYYACHFQLSCIFPLFSFYHSLLFSFILFLNIPCLASHFFFLKPFIFFFFFEATQIFSFSPSQIFLLSSFSASISVTFDSCPCLCLLSSSYSLVLRFSHFFELSFFFILPSPKIHSLQFSLLLCH